MNDPGAMNGREGGSRADCQPLKVAVPQGTADTHPLLQRGARDELAHHIGVRPVELGCQHSGCAEGSHPASGLQLPGQPAAGIGIRAALEDLDGHTVAGRAQSLVDDPLPALAQAPHDLEHSQRAGVSRLQWASGHELLHAHWRELQA